MELNSICYWKTREINAISLIPATVWQILKMKRIQCWPETEIMPEICWNLLGKTREIISSQLIFSWVCSLFGTTVPAIIWQILKKRHSRLAGNGSFCLKSAKICLEKLVKSLQVNLFLAEVFHRKRKLCLKSAETCLEKFVKSLQVNLIFGC